MNVSFFSSPIGLGHATRDIAVYQKMQKTPVQFVTGAGAANIIKKYGFNVIDAYTPPSFNVQKGALQNKLKWLWKYYKYYKECRDISKSIIQETGTKLVISDEDFASMSIAQEKKIPTILITDILETRFIEKFGRFIEKKMNKSMYDIIKRSDRVILPIDGQDDGNICRVGPIVRETKKTRIEIRNEFSFDKKTVIVSVGGTDAGKFLIDKALEAKKSIKQDIDFVLVSGPSIKQQYPNIRNLGFVDNLHELIYAADTVISLAGRSTIDESNAYGTPGIFIPIKDHFEQEDNAKEQGFSHEDIVRLDSLIEEKIIQTRQTARCNGASKAAEIILESINNI